MRWLAASIESSCAEGSWSSRQLQCTGTRSPGFQLRTAEPTRTTTADASEPTTWKSCWWRLPQTDSLARRSRNMNVDSGSKIDVHTVLKLIELAITARYTSSGASSGVATASTCRLLRGALSAESRPSNMAVSSRRTNAAPDCSGIGSAASSSPVAPAWIASRMCCIAGGYPRVDRAWECTPERCWSAPIPAGRANLGAVKISVALPPSPSVADQVAIAEQLGYDTA